jgi:hypothetical protein
MPVFLSFVAFPILERRIKDSRANNLQVEINSQGQRNRTCRLDNQSGGSEQTISAERRIKRSAERTKEEREVKDPWPYNGNGSSGSGLRCMIEWLLAAP